MMLLAACDSGDTRLETRGQISGQVVLDGTPGLNDMSRVQVDLGRGEGSTTPDENGDFAVGDLEPDLYALTISYVGGLTSDAEGSAYRRLEMDVELREGAAVHLGVLQPVLAEGSVKGTVEFSDEGDAEGAQVGITLIDGSQIEAKVEGGQYVLEDVPVGHHRVQALVSGYGQGASAGCGLEATVGQGDEEVSLGALVLYPSRPSFLAGADEVISAEGFTWWVKNSSITVRALTEVASTGRVWWNDAEPSDWGPFLSDGYAVTDLPEGHTEVHFQFRDGCDDETDIFTLDLMRDNTAPAVSQVQVGDGGAFLTTYATNLFVTAQDALSPALEMRHQMCTVDGETWDCPAVLEELAYGAYNPQVPLVFAGEGNFGLKVQVRDQAHNATDVQLVQVEVDTVAPENVSVMVGDGSGTITSPQATVTFSAEGAAFMKLGTAAGLAQTPWLPYQETSSFSFSADDGEKTLYVRLKDLAGNETDELVVNVTLNTTGTIEGLVVIEEQADASVALVSVLGTNLTAAPSSDGSYSITDVPGGVYTVQVSVPGEADRYQDTQYGVAVEPIQTSTLPNLYVELMRGNLRGIIEVEHLDDSMDYSGVAVEVLEAGQTAITGETGAYAVTGLIKGEYTVRMAKPGYAPRTFYNVSIAFQTDTTLDLVGSEKLQLIRGAVSGQVALEGGGDTSSIEVSIPGMPVQNVNADGSFEILDITPGNHTLTLASTTGDYTSHAQPITILGAQTLVLPAVTLNRARGGVAGIIALEDETNHSGVSVTLSSSEATFQAITNGLGSVELSALPTGDYQLTVEKDDFVAHTVPTLTINEGETTDIGTVNLLIHRGSAFGVATFDDATDHSGIQILFTGAEGTAVTDANGDWDFPGIKPGFYNVRAVYEGYTAPTDAVYIGAGQAVELQAAVMTRKRGTVTGFVELENMESHTGVTLTMLSDVPELNEVFQTTSGPDGTYLFSVPVGNYNGIRASKEHYADTELLGTITVTDFGVANADSVLFLAGVSNSVSGKATLASLPLGPHDGIQVTLDGLVGTATEGESQSTNTDADGDFAFDAIPVGSYTVSYTYPADPNREPVTRGLEVLAGLPIVLLPAELRELYLVINDNAPVATEANVELKLGATDADELRIANDVTFADNTSGWQPYTQNTMSWILSAGDGQKTVYVQFKTDIGDLTEILSATILLDSTALASDLALTGGPDFGRGDTMHLALTSGEAGGTAWVDLRDIANGDGGTSSVAYQNGVMLYDDGTNGDAVAGDSIYERNLLIDSPVDVVNGSALGYFSDSYGNESAAQGDPPTVPFTIQAAPAVSNLEVNVEVALGQATITWTTDEASTTTLDWGLDGLYGNQEQESNLIFQHSVILGTGTPLAPSSIYHFAITAADDKGNTNQSTDHVFALRPLQPYLPVVMAGDGRVDLRWECPEQDNIVGYNIRRAEVDGQGVVGDFVLLNTDGPYLHEALLYTDLNVENNKTYHYIISSMDAQDIESIYEESAEPGAEQPTVLIATPLANQGPTNAFGLLSLHTVWTSTHTPIHVTNSIAVPENGTLVIGPGVQVLFDDGPSGERLTLTVRGRLAVYGERGDRIFFNRDQGWEEDDNGAVVFDLSDTNTNSRWGGIVFQAESPPGAFQGFQGKYLRGNIFYRTHILRTGPVGAACYCPWSDCEDAGVDCRGIATNGQALTLLRSKHEKGGPFWSTGDLMMLGSVIRRSGSRALEMSGQNFFADTSVFDYNYGSYGKGHGSLFITADRSFLHGISVVGSKTGQSNNSRFAGGMTIGRDNQSKSAWITESRFRRNFTFADGQNTYWGPGGLSAPYSNDKINVYGTVFFENGGMGALSLNTSSKGCGGCSPANANNSVRVFSSEFLAHREYAEVSSYPHIKGNSIEVFGSLLVDSVSSQAEINASTIVRYAIDGRVNFQGGAPFRYNHIYGDTAGTFIKLDIDDVFEGNSLLTDDAIVGAFVTSISLFDDGIAELSGNHWGASTTAFLNTDPIVTEPVDALKNHPLIFDAREDATLARMNYAPWAPDALPLPHIEGPVVVSAQKAATGFTMTGTATDPEDGLLAPSSLFWVVDGDETGGVTGDTFSPIGLAVGSHTIELWATDGSGQTAKTEYDVEVVNDSGDFIWPRDPNGWRFNEVEVVGFPELGHGRSTTDTTADFSFHCNTPNCTFTCDLDGTTQSCTSPQSYTGLTEGWHEFSVTAFDDQGQALDIPMTFVWKISDVEICSSWQFEGGLWPFFAGSSDIYEEESQPERGVDLQVDASGQYVEYSRTSDGSLFSYETARCKGIRVLMSGDPSAPPDFGVTSPLEMTWQETVDAAEGIQRYTLDATSLGNWGWSYFRLYPPTTGSIRILGVEIYELP
jgi:hypothetical protein